MNKTKAATNRLKMAPMSAASITLTPTAKPARARRTMRVRRGVAVEMDTTSAKARKSMLKASNWPPTPQQAVAKKVEPKAAANAPSAAANGEKFNCLKKHHALNPKKNKATGAKNFE
ncbi:MAG: hypothetical protein ACLPYZ_15270 [Limisphaerales bacterium]